MQRQYKELKLKKIKRRYWIRLTWRMIEQMVEQMLIQEAAAFSLEDSDIGNVTYTSMDIKLHDKTPVQLNYHSVPKPLYTELKANIEDLLKRG